MERKGRGSPVCHPTPTVCPRVVEIEKLLSVQVENLEKSIAVAKTELDRRLETMNQFRDQLNKQASTFATRENVTAALDTANTITAQALKTATIATDLSVANYTKQVEEDRKRIRDLELWRSNMDGRVIMIMLGMPLVWIIIEILFRSFFK